MVRCGSAALAVSALLLPGWASSTPPVNCGARLLMFDDFDSLHLLAWRGEPGGNTTVLLEPRYPWEADVHSEGTVLYDSVAAECKDLTQPDPHCMTAVRPSVGPCSINRIINKICVP